MSVVAKGGQIRYCRLVGLGLHDAYGKSQNGMADEREDGWIGWGWDSHVPLCMINNGSLQHPLCLSTGVSATNAPISGSQGEGPPIMGSYCGTTVN